MYFHVLLWLSLFSKDYRADKQRMIQTKIAEKEKKKNNIRKRITEGALLELSCLPPLGKLISNNFCWYFLSFLI